MSIKKILKDARGAALVYVIVASALIILLGAATTATAYVNLRATQVQENSDNNFYSADTIMNVIKSGLERDISLAYENAYALTVTKADTYDTPEEMYEDFKTEYLNYLDERLNDSRSSYKWYYNMNYIQDYVEDVFKEDIQYTISAVNGDNYIDVTDTGLILRNLHVTYEDGSGYFDEITTDIKIAIPQADLIPPQPPIPLKSDIVIDDGLELDFGTGLSITGNTYINERESDKSAILLNGTSSLMIASPEELIAGGFIDTKENTKLIFKGSSLSTINNADASSVKNIVWTENIRIGRDAVADLSGVLYVYDDLEVNGSYSTVYLAGDYYGYSKSHTNAADSSSININGAHTTLDIEKLDMLLLAGSSYISTSTVDSSGTGGTNSSNVQTGEALSVKSNQIAYFVDDKEFDNSDVALFLSNPMSVNDYELMCQRNTNWSTVKNKILTKKLSYGKSYTDFGVTDITPVFSSKDGGTVYLYLSFSDPDKAAEYFVTAYKGDSLLSQRLRTYAAQYITSLKIGSDNSFLVNENFINTSTGLYTEDNLLTILEGLGYNEAEPNQSSMDSILSKIKGDYLDNGQVDGNGAKYKQMYEKIINEDKLKEFISKATDASYSYTDHHTNNEIELTENGVILTGTSGSKAIIVDNANKAPYELGDGKGIVVVTGDLNITGNWLGTIIVGGRAYCTGGAKDAPLEIISNLDTVVSVGSLYFANKEGDETNYMMVMNIFKGYEDAIVNNASTSTITKDQVSNLITFTNWNKE